MHVLNERAGGHVCFHATARFGWLLLALMLISSRATAQTLEECPNPSVALYSCDTWPANTDSVSAISLSRNLSHYIYQLIYADTSIKEVLLISGSIVDSLTFSNVGDSVIYFPFVAPADSVGGTTMDYIVMSGVTGNSGNFTLTVSLENGHTRYHVVDGTSHFSSTTDTNSLRTACISACAPLLPLASTINTYERQLEAANPALSINPVITVTPIQSKVALKASIPVTFQVNDCDGTPLPNRPLTLNAKGGKFVTSQVSTDQNGQATAVFTAGNKNQFGLLTASITDAPTVRYDTVSTDGSAVITIGNPVDTVGKFELTYSMSVTFVSFLDQFVVQKGTSEEWDQYTTLQTFSAKGVAIVPVTFLDDGTMLLNSSDADIDSSIDFATGKMHEHDFNFDNGWAWSSEACENTSVTMGGTSLNGKIDSAGASVSVQYGPGGRSLEAAARFSNCHGPSYIEVFGTSNCEDLGPPVPIKEYHIEALGADVSDTAAVVGGSRTAGFAINSQTSMTLSQATYDPENGSSTSDSIIIKKFTGFLKPISSLTYVNKTPGNGIPKAYALYQNYPNPFNPTTIISYDLPRGSYVKVTIYDVLGRVVATLVEGVQQAGHQVVDWSPSTLSSGVYFCRIQTHSQDGSTNFTATKKLLFMK